MLSRSTDRSIRIWDTSHILYIYTRTIHGVSNGLPHTTYRLPLDTPWMVQVYMRLLTCKFTAFYTPRGKIPETKLSMVRNGLNLRRSSEIPKCNNCFRRFVLSVMAVVTSSNASLKASLGSYWPWTQWLKVDRAIEQCVHRPPKTSEHQCCLLCDCKRWEGAAELRPAAGAGL